VERGVGQRAEDRSIVRFRDSNTDVATRRTARTRMQPWPGRRAMVDPFPMRLCLQWQTAS